jgi:hypothetical protein
MTRLYLPIFLLLAFTLTATTVDPIGQVAAFIRQGDIAGLTSLCADNVEVAVLDEENTYSKAQTGLILNKFFTEHKPTSVKILHKVNSSPNYRFAVLLLGTGNGSYRVTFTLKGIGGNLALIEFRIEAGH